MYTQFTTKETREMEMGIMILLSLVYFPVYLLVCMTREQP